MSIFDDDLTERSVGVCEAYDFYGSSYVGSESNEAFKFNFSLDTIKEMVLNSDISQSQKENIKELLKRIYEKQNVCIEYVGLIGVLLSANHLGENYLSDLFTKCLKSKWQDNKVIVKVIRKDPVIKVELTINTYYSQRFHFILTKKF